MKYIFSIFLIMTITATTSANSLCIHLNEAFVKTKQEHCHQTKHTENKHNESCPICDFGICNPIDLKNINDNSSYFFSTSEDFKPATFICRNTILLDKKVIVSRLYAPPYQNLGKLKNWQAFTQIFLN